MTVHSKVSKNPFGMLSALACWQCCNAAHQYGPKIPGRVRVATAALHRDAARMPFQHSLASFNSHIPVLPMTIPGQLHLLRLLDGATIHRWRLDVVAGV